MIQPSEQCRLGWAGCPRGKVDPALLDILGMSCPSSSGLLRVGPLDQQHWCPQTRSA